MVESICWRWFDDIPMSLGSFFGRFMRLMFLRSLVGSMMVKMVTMVEMVRTGFLDWWECIDFFC